MKSGGDHPSRGNGLQRQSNEATSASTQFVVVGVLTRVEPSLREKVIRLLGDLSSVSTFEVGDDLKLGALIETATLDEAKTVLEQQIETIPGVLAGWPVFIHQEPGLPLVEGISVAEKSPHRFERIEVQ